MLEALLRKLTYRFARIAQRNAIDSAKDQPLMQHLFISEVQRTYREKKIAPNFSEVEFCAYSQNAEDGILLCVFALIGFKGKRAVEVCCGDGIECNSANLIINHGFAALLFDGDKANIAAGREFYAKRTNGWRLRRLPPLLVGAWVTAENLNDLISSNGFTGEVDLLSIDVDGNDLWLWKAVDVVSPRVVVIEYNNRLPSDRAITIPYDAKFFTNEQGQAGGGFFGASLLALVRVGQHKGYRLVGANSPNTNAVFIRNDVAADVFPEVSVESCLSSDYARSQQQLHWNTLSSREWIEIH